MVSVIIPNFNNAYWLSKTIKSCLIQGNLLTEVIVVDDHSTDNSLEILSEFADDKRIRVFQNEGNGGNSARVSGFYKSKGDFIQWLDADDQLLAEKFSYQIKCLENTKADVVISDWRIDYYEDDLFIRSESKKNNFSDDFCFDLLLDRWSSPNAYLMTRKAAEKTIEWNGWNQNRRIGQDREFFTTAALHGLNFVYTPGEFAVYNKWSKVSVSQLKFKDRLILDNELNIHFKNFIKQNVRDNRREKYLYALHTHLIKSIFYNYKIEFDELFNLTKIHWEIVHPKMKIVLPLIYLLKSIQFIYRSFRKSLLK